MQRIAGILAIGGGLILISWVTSPAARPADRDPRLPPSEIERVDDASQAVTPVAGEIDAQAARLRARLSQPPPKPQPDRNPFRFGAATPAPRAAAPMPKGPAPALSEAAGAVGVKSPTISMPVLVAITSDACDGGLMRTAVLSMDDEMKIVRPGQIFERFIVDAIGPDSVRIVDVTSPARATFTIAIR